MSPWFNTAIEIFISFFFMIFSNKKTITLIPMVNFPSASVKVTFAVALITSTLLPRFCQSRLAPEYFCFLVAHFDKI
jgi:hypothetical protein